VQGHARSYVRVDTLFFVCCVQHFTTVVAV
jgi:hypothetical protein